MQLPKENRDENTHNGGSNNSSMVYNNIMEEPDFSEFMWMANEDLEAFDRKVISEIDEQLFIDSAVTLAEEEEEFLQNMLEEEEERDTVYYIPKSQPSRDPLCDLTGRLQNMQVQPMVNGRVVAQSTLNPDAAEFVPGQSNFNGPKPSSQDRPFVYPQVSMINMNGANLSQNMVMNPLNSYCPRLTNTDMPQLTQAYNSQNGYMPGVPIYMTNLGPVYPVITQVQNPYQHNPQSLPPNQRNLPQNQQNLPQNTPQNDENDSNNDFNH